MNSSPLACRKATALVLSMSAGAALAHPGHDASPQFGLLDGLLHMLTQPDHLSMLAGAALIGVAAVVAYRTSRSARRRRP